jgi:hypothetical protein
MPVYMKPARFSDPERSMEIHFDENKRAHLTVWPTMTSCRDLDGFLPSDMPANAKLSANHSHIYIDGSLEAGAWISLRQGIVSARSLGKDSEVMGGILLIISDAELSRMSKNLKRPSNDYPTILVVPEAERARTFDSLTEQIQYYPGCPAEQLKEFVKNNPKMPVKIIPGNWEHAALLSEAGLSVDERPGPP